MHSTTGSHTTAPRENAPGNVPLHRRQTTGKCSTVRLRDGVGFVATEVTRQLTAPESIWAYPPDIRCELEPGDRLVSSSTRSSQARERRNRSRTSAVRAVLRNLIARLQIRAILNLLDDVALAAVRARKSRQGHRIDVFLFIPANGKGSGRDTHPGRRIRISNSNRIHEYAATFRGLHDVVSRKMNSRCPCPPH